MMRVALLLSTCAVLVAADDAFVLIKGGQVPGKLHIRVEDFEMQAYPVTNLQYKQFVDATAYAAPLHWTNGRIPEGMEQWPVVFVNRFDVAAYLDWISRRDNRIYRLPTAAEFEYASMAGSKRVYPWGDEAPEGHANFDASGKRTFGQWRTHLKPVKSYSASPWGLYDIAGNVWQMVDRNTDLATNRFVYRVVSPAERESSLAGGSWARAAYYLKCGVFGGASSGIRHPDIGFRPVREPAGSTHFRKQPRRLIAKPSGAGAIFLGWQWLASDAPSTGFHVYRSVQRDSSGERITSQPVTASTAFADTPDGKDRVYYRVRPVVDGKEGPPSEWAGVDPSSERDPLLVSIEPTTRKGGIVPVFGDLDGDGVLDVVMRLDNGIHEMSRDPGVPVELEAFTSYGRALWRRPLIRHENCFGSANNAPIVVHDFDGDGKAEIAARLEEDNRIYLAILDGMTGRVLRRTPWRDMATDFAKSSTRIHLAVAYLDGRTPALVSQTGLYENEIFDAFDVELKRLWTFESFAETNGSGSHHIDIADVDGDGKDEVFDGTTLLGSDGRMRWSIYREHPDIVAIKHILPGSRDRQVFYAVESSVHAGAYLVDAKTGRIIWKVNREDDPRWTHAHMGWVADIWDGSPGLEMITNRDGHLTKDQVLFAPEGRILVNPFEPGWWPVNWTGGTARDLMSLDGKRLGRFDGREVQANGPGPNAAGSGRCGMVADLAGDFRDEVVCVGAAADGGPVLRVYTNLEPPKTRAITRTSSREYRLWLSRNMGGGYPSYFEWEPED